MADFNEFDKINKDDVWVVGSSTSGNTHNVWVTLFGGKKVKKQVNSLQDKQNLVKDLKTKYKKD